MSNSFRSSPPSFLPERDIFALPNTIFRHSVKTAENVTRIALLCLHLYGFEFCSHADSRGGITKTELGRGSNFIPPFALSRSQTLLPTAPDFQSGTPPSSCTHTHTPSPFWLLGSSCPSREDDGCAIPALRSRRPPSPHAPTEKPGRAWKRPAEPRCLSLPHQLLPRGAGERRTPEGS